MAQQYINPQTGEVIEWDGKNWKPVPSDSKRTGPGFARSALQGITFGFGDEIEAAMRAGGEKLADTITGKNAGLTYKQHLDDIRREQEAYSKENQMTALGAELGGGLLTGGAGAAKAAAMLPNSVMKLPQFARLAGAGAGFGALSGAGHSEDDRLGGALSGAQIGAITGAAIPAGAWLGGKIVKGATLPIVNRMRKPASFAKRKLSQAIERDGMNVDDVMTRLDDLGPGASVTDAAGENVLGLARGTTAVPGPAKNAARQLLDARQSGQQGRILSAVGKELGADDDIYGLVDKVTQNIKTKAAPLYKDAYSVNIPPNSTLKSLLMRPSIQAAWKKAQRMANDEGIELPQVFTIKDGKVVGVENMPNMQAWDYIKRGLDDVISDNADDFGRANNVGRIATSLKRQLLDVLDEVNPTYKLARQTYAGEKANETAMQLGRKFLNEDAPITKKMLSSMSEAERESYLVGAMNAIRNKVMAAGETHNAARRLVRSPLIKERLQPLFNDKEGFDRFLQRVETEEVFTNTRNMVLGGSPTARISEEARDLAVDPGIAESALQGDWKRAAGRFITNLVERPLTESDRTELSKLLFTQDAKINQDNLRNLYRLADLSGKRKALADALQSAGVIGGSEIGGMAVAR